MKRYVAVFVFALGACGGKAKPAEPTVISSQPAAEEPPEPVPTPGPPPLDGAVFEARMNQAMAMFEAMGQAADDAGQDCGLAAAGIAKVLDDNRDFVRDAKTWDDDPTFKAQAEEWMKAHLDQMMAPMMKVGTLGQTCSTDPKFTAVMKRFDELE